MMIILSRTIKYIFINGTRSHIIVYYSYVSSGRSRWIIIWRSAGAKPVFLTSRINKTYKHLWVFFFFFWNFPAHFVYRFDIRNTISKSMRFTRQLFTCVSHFNGRTRVRRLLATPVEPSVLAKESGTDEDAWAPTVFEKKRFGIVAITERTHKYVWTREIDFFFPC